MEAAMGFVEEHAKQPLLSIRDDLFDTFHKRHREGRELGDVKITAESLQKIRHECIWMLKEFVAETKGKDTAEGASEQQLMEEMMHRYETELTHHVRNLLGGELARALLIHVGSHTRLFGIFQELIQWRSTQE